jgi:electron transfer flavoprotein alpha/beta subunit
MKAKKKRLDVMKASDIGATELGKEGSKTELVKMFIPVSEHKAEIIQGDAKQAAAALINKLKNEVKVI